MKVEPGGKCYEGCVQEGKGGRGLLVASGDPGKRKTRMIRCGPKIDIGCEVSSRSCSAPQSWDGERGYDDTESVVL